MFDFLGSVLGSVLGFVGQENANDANAQQAVGATAFNREQADLSRIFSADQAARAMAFSSSEAATNRQFQDAQVTRQMGFQEEMANTAYQRAVGDMKSAGLNPMLAYSQGGAAVPSGASAAGAAGSGFAGSSSPGRGVTARMENSLAPAINSGVMVARVQQELKNMDEQNKNLKSQRERIDADTELIRAQIPYTQQATLTSGASANLMHNRISQVQAEVLRLYEETDNLREKRRSIRGEADLREFDVKYMRPAELKLVDAQRKLLELEIPRASNVASAQGSWWMQNMSPYVQDFLGIGRGAGGLGLRLRR